MKFKNLFRCRKLIVLALLLGVKLAGAQCLTTIFNNTNVVVRFTLGPNTWSLNPGATANYQIPCPSGVITVPTLGFNDVAISQVSYTVLAKGHYQIYWNAAYRRMDLVRY